MNAAELQEIGRRLFGNRWKAPLAVQLGITRQTIWRYLRDDHVRPAVAMRISLLRKEDLPLKNKRKTKHRSDWA